jgi:anti-sigma factor RsiW
MLSKSCEQPWNKRMTDDNSLHELLVEYTLGALAPAERRAFEAHLIVCEECSKAIDATTSLVVNIENLRDTSTGAAPMANPAVHEEQKSVRLRWLARVGTLVVGAAAGLVIGLSLAHNPASIAKPTSVIAMPSPSTGVNGSLALYEKPWGTQVRATFANLPTKGQIRMVVASTSGHVTTAWLGTRRTSIALDAAIPYRPNAIKWVGVYSSNGRLIDSWSQ